MAIKRSIPSISNQIKSATFKELKGVDFSSSPFEVDSSRAVFAKNLINENGVNHKRQGWKTILNLDSDAINIKAIFIIKIANENFLIIIKKNSATQKNVKLCSYTINNNEININVTTPVVNANITHSSSTSSADNYYCFSKKDKIFLKWAGAYVCISYNGAVYSISEVSNSLAYVPTTTISINCDDDKTATRAKLESANLLNIRRKNKLVGYNKVKLVFSFNGTFGSTTYPNPSELEVTLTDSNNTIFKYKCNEYIELLPGQYSYTIRYTGGNSTDYTDSSDKTGSFTIHPYYTITGNYTLIIVYGSGGGSGGAPGDGGSGGGTLM